MDQKSVLSENLHPTQSSMNSDLLFDHLFDSLYEENRDFFQRCFQGLESKGELSLHLEGLPGTSAKSLFLLNLQRKYPKTTFVVITSSNLEAERFYQDLLNFQSSDSKSDWRSNSKNRVIYLPFWNTLPYERLAPSKEITHQRMQGLDQLLDWKGGIVVSPIANFLQSIVPKKTFEENILQIGVSQKLNLKSFLFRLIELGYQKEDQVEWAGQFSLKGCILDIFPCFETKALRMELFDEQIESLRLFNPETKVSIRPIEKAKILPCQEVVLSGSLIASLLPLPSFSSLVRRIQAEQNSGFQTHSIPSTKEEILELFRQFSYKNRLEGILPFLYERASLLDYLNGPCCFLLDEEGEIKKQAHALSKEYQKLYDFRFNRNSIQALPEEHLLAYRDMYSKLEKKFHLSQYGMTIHSRNDSEELASGEISDKKASLSLRSPESWGAKLELFKKKAELKIQEGFILILFVCHIEQAKRLAHAMQELGTFLLSEEPSKKTSKETSKKTSKAFLQKIQKKGGLKPGIYIRVGNLSSAVELREKKILLIPEESLLGKGRQKKLQSVSSVPIEQIYEIKEKDLVVHLHYGIARYLGIERNQVAGKTKDYILLEYAGSEKLYVPSEQLNLIQKYIGATSQKASLTRLGTKTWERTKNRVQESIQELAHELVQIYAERKKQPGYAFPKDTRWQEEFEAQFPYEETVDQIRAIEDVKKDMEKAIPCDRLICGDLGFGKTEIAIRASFKAVMSGKQVAVLSPTTLLCEQHFKNFQERFSGYPVRIESLSRWKSPKEQKTTVENLKKGKIDIVIGTHRLLSGDIGFKNLGLLIIDEEQRFGVRHKERLKSIKVLVDTLALSATPIPRTLHMALTRIREISLIQSPPLNRRSVITHVMEFNEEIIQSAIQKELSRRGQVFFLFNRIGYIRSFARFIQGLVPDARVGIAHGQMKEEELEWIMTKFLNQDYDILIATTIIESGLDMPNVNTIFIERADTLGLSQLYQLRGRVGRSDRQAYCYLLYPEDRALSEIAQKRLSVINQYSELGSSFQIALKDLELRGSGNVFGKEQSGNIMSIGFELYTKLLDQAIQEISTGKPSRDFELYIELDYEGFLPHSYIRDERQRIEIYKKISSLKKQEERKALEEELRDRFGEIPAPMDALLRISELRIQALELRVLSIVERNKIQNNSRENSQAPQKEIEITLDKHSSIEPEAFVSLIQKYSDRIRINPKNSQKLYLKAPNNSKIQDTISWIQSILEDLSSKDLSSKDLSLKDLNSKDLSSKNSKKALSI